MNEKKAIELGHKLLEVMSRQDTGWHDAQLLLKGAQTLSDYLYGRPLTTRSDVFAVRMVRAIKAWKFVEGIYILGEDPLSPYYRKAWEDYDEKSCWAAGMDPKPGEIASEKELAALGCIWDVVDPVNDPWSN